MGTFASYIGKISIPEEKKEEFNANMIKLLQRGGMVKFDNVKLYDKEINLISPVELDTDGNCYFHYNYFEDDPWETAGFDSNSNILWSEKIGSDEFNFVICAGYFLTELYSEDHGWVSVNGDILNYPDYVQWINFILDKDFSLEKRFDLWKHYELYALGKVCNGHSAAELNHYAVFDFVPKGYEEYMGGTELADIFYIANGTEEGMEDVAEGSYAEEVLNLKKELKEYYFANPKDGRDNIWQLITMPMDKRKNISGTDYDKLAEISLRLAARVFVYLSAEILDFSFWDEWHKIYEDVYDDEKALAYVSDNVLNKRKEQQAASLGKIKTSEFLRNDGYFTFHGTPEEIRYKGNYYISDDDLMYWWDESEIIELSDRMKKQILKWKQDYDEVIRSISKKEVDGYDMIKNLIDVLDCANNHYKRIFAFKEMFYEFLGKGKDVKYIAAVKLFDKVVEDNKEKGRIIEKAGRSWDITSKNVTFNEGRVTIKRFLSLMANKKLRSVYFGF